uniref:Uncharacterized protein n=1 Tax=Oryza sativa subsp. japonica TaxID=39947 RepID=Q67UK5_ORYSJ|nr:hypothetical protein [Oryza sativa Japonica Group]
MRTVEGREWRGRVDFGGTLSVGHRPLAVASQLGVTTRARDGELRQSSMLRARRPPAWAATRQGRSTTWDSEEGRQHGGWGWQRTGAVENGGDGVPRCTKCLTRLLHGAAWADG